MSFRASFIFLLTFSFLNSFRASAQNLSILNSFCPNTTTYSPNSTYSTNLRTLLSSLSSRKASFSTGFQNATVGQAPDRVTGLFLCRGDVSSEVCRTCVAFSVNEALNRCPNQREAVLYYDECMLRYSHRNILSTLRTDGGYTLANTNDIPPHQLDRFRNLVLSTLNQAATKAAASSRNFDARKASFTSLQSLYGLVQCTPDLTKQDCLRCLQTSINQLPTEKIGGRLLLPSCSSRYELYQFYNESAIRIPPPATT